MGRAQPVVGDGSARRAARDHEEVRARADQRRLGLHGPSCKEDRVSTSGVVPAFEEVTEPGCDAFNTNDLNAVQPSRACLLRKLGWVVEVRGREPVRYLGRVPMLTVPQIVLDDRAEVRIKEKLATQPIEQGREPRDRGNEHRPARSDDSSRLLERLQSIGSIRQVVERSEKKYGIGTVVLGGEAASVTHLSSNASAAAGQPLRGLNMVGHRIDDVHRVAIVREPLRMGARGSADIVNRERTWRKVSSNDLSSPEELESPCAAGQSLRLDDLGLVVLANL